MHNVEKIKAVRIYAAAAAAFVLSAVFCVAVIKSGSGDTEAAELISGGEDRPVIVIDAGHGGVDDGASASDGTAEKDINLAIALRLRDIISEYPAEVVLTRENDDELLEGYDGKGGRKRYDMENRVTIIENCDPDLVVSIHLNSFPQDETVRGAQTFYPEKNTDDGAAASSREFARCVQSSLSENIPGSESRQALAKAGLTVDDIDLFEINEAFASQCIACQRELGIPDDKLNVNGGGISLGHPVGATGSRLIVTLMYELKKRGEKYGLATLCAGGGMGTAVVIEMM